MGSRGRVAQIDNARKSRLAGTESAGDRPALTPREAIEQGMARQNVRIGRGHAPADPAKNESRATGSRFIVILIAILLVGLALWIALV